MKIEDTVVFEEGIYSLVLKRTMNIFQSGGVSTMSLLALILAETKCDIFTSDCVVFVMTTAMKRINDSYNVFICLILIYLVKFRP